MVAVREAVIGSRFGAVVLEAVVLTRRSPALALLRILLGLERVGFDACANADTCLRIRDLLPRSRPVVLAVR